MKFLLKRMLGLQNLYLAVDGGGEGGGGEGSGDTGGEGGGGEGSGDTQTETVSLAQFNELKAKLTEISSKKQELEDSLKEQRNAKLKENEDYKTLFENAKTELEQTTEKLDKFKGGYQEQKRIDAVRTEAIKAGIREEALEDLDHLVDESVSTELTSKGRVLVNGAKTFVANLKKKRAYLFQEPGIRKFNSGGGTQPTGGSEGTKTGGGKEDAVDMDDPASIHKLRTKDPVKFKKARQEWWDKRLKQDGA